MRYSSPPERPTEENHPREATKFKKQCLSILDRVGEEGIVITKRGKPVAKLIPIRTESAQLIGKLKGRLKVKGDVFSTGLKWRAES